MAAALRRPCAAGRHRRGSRLPRRRQRARRRPGVALTAPAQQLVRLDLGGEVRWAVRTAAGDSPLSVGLDDLLGLSVAEAREVVESAGEATDLGGTLLPPVDSQEVWGRRHLRAQPIRPDGGVDGGGHLRPGLPGISAGGVLQGDRVAGGHAVAFVGSASTASITRRLEDLVGWLTAALNLPVGAILLTGTGTGIVPEESFTLQ